jgi:signal transduction histidine kinase
MSNPLFFHKRTRFSVVLVTFLLLIIVAGAVYTISLVQAQRRAYEDSIDEAQSHAIALLADQIEQTINRAMRPPFLSLKNLPFDAIANKELTEFLQTVPEFRRVLFLDKHMRVVSSYPPMKNAGERIFNHWFVKRAALEKFDRRTFTVHTFVEYIDGKFELFALQRASELDANAGWLLINFNLQELIKRRIDPILVDFAKRQSGSITLKDPQAEWDDNALNWPVARTLPGWMLVFKPDPGEAAKGMRYATLTALGVSAGVVLALLVGGYLLWNEIRRERELTDLRNGFVANVSHELKTPLTLIRMYAETLYLRRVTDPERRQTYLGTILNEAERLTYMIESVLDFSRINQGIKIYHLNDTDLRATLDQVIETYSAKVKEHEMRLETVMEDVPPVAHDRRGITQIVVNLFDNAIKYADSGGVLSLTLHRINDEEVELAVQDQGPGIVETDRERVRRAFERSGDFAKVAGAGLGLALVDQIAAVHQARFVLDDGLDGRGLKASIAFPVKRVDS